MLARLYSILLVIGRGLHTLGAFQDLPALKATRLTSPLYQRCCTPECQALLGQGEASYTTPLLLSNPSTLPSWLSRQGLKSHGNLGGWGGVLSEHAVPPRSHWCLPQQPYLQSCGPPKVAAAVVIRLLGAWPARLQLQTSWWQKTLPCRTANYQHGEWVHVRRVRFQAFNLFEVPQTAHVRSWGCALGV